MRGWETASSQSNHSHFWIRKLLGAVVKALQLKVVPTVSSHFVPVLHYHLTYQQYISDCTHKYDLLHTYVHFSPSLLPLPTYSSETTSGA